MAIFAEVLGPSFKRIELRWNGALMSTAFAEPSVAGVPATDPTGKIMVNFKPRPTRLPVIGIVSLLMFWSMLEMGVGMIAVCLPTLRALFLDWSPKSNIHTFRSSLPLRSFTSKGKAYRLAPDERHKGGDSEAYLADVEAWGVLGEETQHQAFAMAHVHAQKAETARVPVGAIRVDKNLTQTVDS